MWEILPSPFREILNFPSARNAVPSPRMAEADSAPSPSDDELVDRVVGGDIGAFDQLVLRHQERLYKVIYNMTSDHDSTNDLLMETFDKAYRSLSSFKRQASFSTWLTTIAINKAINHAKSAKKRSNDLSLNELDFEEGISQDLWDASVTSDPARQMHLQELQIRLNESLQKLSNEHRAVVVLYDIDGHSHAEIAEILGCNENTVRTRLHYAHKQLKKSLEKFTQND